VGGAACRCLDAVAGWPVVATLPPDVKVRPPESDDVVEDDLPPPQPDCDEPAWSRSVSPTIRRIFSELRYVDLSSILARPRGVAA
jgi:hypothetical protein